MIFDSERDHRNRVGDPVSIEDMEKAIHWLRENEQLVKDARIKTGGRTVEKLTQTLRIIIDLAKPGDVHLGRVKLPIGKKKNRPDASYLYSSCIQANNLLRFWGEHNEQAICPSISKDGGYLTVTWSEIPIPSDDSPAAVRRVWVLLPRWFDEYIDQFLAGMSVMAEVMGIGLAIQTVDESNDIPGIIETIAKEHSEPRESVSIVILLDNINDERTSEGIYRARRLVEKETRGHLFITTVGHEVSHIRLNNEKIGEALATRMLEDLARTGRLDGKVIIIGTSDQDWSNAHRSRRRAFRNVVMTRREGDFPADLGHHLDLPNFPSHTEIDHNLMFDEAFSWTIRDLLLEYLEGPDGADVRAVYTQTTLATLGAGLAIQQSGRDDILLYAEYISPSLLRWLKDEKWPLAAICGVDPHQYGRLVFRTAATRTADVLTPTVIPPLLIGREAVREGDRLTYMVELPRVFPGKDVFLETLNPEVRNNLAKDIWFRKYFDRVEQSRERSKIK